MCIGMRRGPRRAEPRSKSWKRELEAGLRAGSCKLRAACWKLGAGSWKLTAVAILLALLCGPLHAANRYDPRFRFRTISTPHFNIYFHQREEALARRLARIAEEVAAKVGRDLGVPAGRVHVI